MPSPNGPEPDSPDERVARARAELQAPPLLDCALAGFRPDRSLQTVKDSLARSEERRRELEIEVCRLPAPLDVSSLPLEQQVRLAAASFQKARGRRGPCGCGSHQTHLDVDASDDPWHGMLAI